MASVKTKSKFDIFIDEKFLKIEKKNVYIIYFLVLLVPLLIIFYFVLLPNYKKINISNKQIATLKNEITKARKVANDLPKYKKELEDVKLVFETTSTLLPKSQEIPNLLRNISDLGKNAGLDFLTFTPGQEIPKDFYAEIPIDISIKGPYHNLGSFLDKVSKLDRIVTVDNITIDKPEIEGTEMLLNSTCKLLTYRFTNVKVEPIDQKNQKVANQKLKK